MSAGELEAVVAPRAPWWFEQSLIVVCATVLAWGGAGELLAYRGDYTLARAAIIGSLGTIVAIAFVAMRVRPVDRAPSSRPAIAMLLVAGAVAAYNAIYAGHHVAGDRDPGIYSLAGKWLSGHGSFIVPAGVGWPAHVPNLVLSSGGTYTAAGGTVQFQFAHFLPTLLAEGQNIGGDRLMFRVNGLVGALALLVLFAVGCRLCRRPWLVVAAVFGLAMTIPELYTLRDTFSEPSTQLMLWTGIWLLVLAMDARSGWRDLGVAVLAGAALGATVMTRIDGVAYLIFLPLLAAIGWLARPEERRHLLRTYAAVVVGLVPPVVIGTLDVQRRSASYYAALRHDVLSLWAAFVAMAVVGVVLVLVWPRSRALREVIARYRSRAAVVAASIVAIGLVLAWAIRPAIQKLRWPSGIDSLPYLSLNRQLQHQEGLGLDGLRTYGERSVDWLAWYLGPFALALAIVGLAFLLARLIREPSVVVAVMLLVAGSLSAEYLWNPNVNGDQPWAMRRFVPAVLPLCALLAAAALEWLWRFAQRVRPRLGASALGAVAVVAFLVFPIGHALPVRALTIQEHFPDAVHATCAGLGADAAVLVVGQGFDTVYVQTLRDWCDVPVVGLDAPVGAPTLQALSRSWHARGRRLWLVSSAPALLQGLALPPRQLGSADSVREIEITLSRIPQQYVSKKVAFWAAPV